MNEQVPHNREAEMAVVGSVLIDPECFPTIDIRADDFYIHRHRFIWEAFQHLDNANVPIDFLTLTTRLEETGQLSEIGGVVYLTSLLNEVPTSMNARAYAKEVKKHAANRRYLTIANKLAQSAYADTVDPPSLIDEIVQNLPVEGGARTTSDTLRELDKEVQERMADPKPVWGIPTGLYDFDKITGGLHPQETTLIVGPPEVGKTTLLLQICIDVAITQKRHVALYEMEMDTKRLLHRAIFMLGGPSPRTLKSGYFKEKDHEPYLKALEKLDTPYLHISDTPMMTTTDMRADLARLRAKYPIALVGVDYLNLFSDRDGRDENERAKLRSRRFRAICREANVCGISIQSLNKEGIAKGVAEIQDVSGPAEIGFDADWIYALSIDNTLTKMTPLKGRDADGRGVIELTKKGLRFENLIRPSY